MTTQELIFLGVCETIALLFIARLWVKRTPRLWVGRVFWSVVLLVPLFGLLAYFFLRDSPEEHPHEVLDTTGAETRAEEVAHH